MATMNYEVWSWGRPLHTFNNIRWEDRMDMYSLPTAVPGMVPGAVYLVEDVAKVCAIACVHAYTNEGRHE